MTIDKSNNPKIKRSTKSWILLFIVSVLAIASLSYAVYESHLYSTNRVKYQPLDIQTSPQPKPISGTPVR